MVFCVPKVPLVQHKGSDLTMEQATQIVGSKRDSLRIFLTGQGVHPVPVRWSLCGAIWLGGVGMVIGGVVGLVGYPPTAVFATFELGIPASFTGAMVGLVTGAIVALSRRARPRKPQGG